MESSVGSSEDDEWTETRFVHDGTTIFSLVGHLPPKQLHHLALQRCSVLTTSDTRLRVFLVGKTMRVGTCVLDAVSWTGVHYNVATRIKFVRPLPPLRGPATDYGSLLRLNLQRKRDAERR